MVFQALTAESCAAVVTEPLACPHFILAGKAEATNNYNHGGRGGVQSLKTLLERASTLGRMTRSLGICLKIWKMDLHVPATPQPSWVTLAKPGTTWQWC